MALVDVSEARHAEADREHALADNTKAKRVWVGRKDSRPEGSTVRGPHMYTYVVCVRLLRSAAEVERLKAVAEIEIQASDGTCTFVKHAAGWG